MANRKHRTHGTHRRNNGVYGQRGNHSNNSSCLPMIIIMVGIPIALVTAGLAILG
jgi:hypothetical protein